jgi:hypothetical protein
MESKRSHLLYSLGPVYEFVCDSFRTGHNVNLTKHLMKLGIKLRVTALANIHLQVGNNIYLL